jgi:hypothetical protein
MPERPGRIFGWRWTGAVVNETGLQLFHLFERYTPSACSRAGLVLVSFLKSAHRGLFRVARAAQLTVVFFRGSKCLPRNSISVGKARITLAQIKLLRIP